jgi:hypothetical protein
MNDRRCKNKDRHDCEDDTRLGHRGIVSRHFLFGGQEGRTGSRGWKGNGADIGRREEALIYC